ncbi:MAG: tetraacyldisaccharide 4'-kinase [Thermodesulfobacteriota bacterium]
MRAFYNLLLTAFFALASPFFLAAAVFSAKRRGTVLKRMGFQALTDNRLLDGVHRPVWIHALSVGEVLSAVELAVSLKQAFPGRPIVFSATTKTGIATAESRLTGIADEIFYFCYDLPFTVCRMVDRVNPGMVVIVESDIWPNFLRTLEKRRIPVVLANARLSEKSFAGYRRFAWVMRPALKVFAAVCAQTGRDKDRFAALGVPADRIAVAGNIKFDQPAPDVTNERKKELRRLLGVGPEIRILVAGSTHPGEEEMVARAVDAAGKSIEKLMLVVAPRDPARAGAVRDLLGGPAAGVFTLTEVNQRGGKDPVRMVVIDRIGLLKEAYAIADAAFIGGSLLNFRGHNPLEPAACKKPVLFGPHMEDFAEIAQLLIDGGGARRVRDAGSLGAAVAELLADNEARRRMGEAAFHVFETNRGALDRVMAVCREFADKAPNRQASFSGFFSVALVPLSVLYGLAARLRRELYAGGIIKSRQLPCPVVSVGNITVGGTGKTPMTIYIARLLMRMGRSPMIVSRGYRGTASATGGMVSDGKRIRMDVHQAGDEPFMMARSLSGVPVVVGKKRYAAATAAMEKTSPDVVILDDGFQHFQLARDLNIVLMDSARPVGNGRLLPAGPLREPLSCLTHADAFVFTRSDPAGEEKPPGGVIGPYVKSKPVFRACHRPVVAGRIGAGAAGPLSGSTTETLQGMPVFVFCGLARNREFLKSVQQVGARVLGHLFFPDHCLYKKEDLSAVLEKASAAGAKILVTSEKDYVKIASLGPFDRELAVLGVEIDFGPDTKRFESFVASALGMGKSSAH